MLPSLSHIRVPSCATMCRPARACAQCCGQVSGLRWRRSVDAIDVSIKQAQMAFWLRAWYGFMMFPFLFFKLPGFARYITSANPTGYNTSGTPALWQPQLESSAEKEQEKARVGKRGGGERERARESARESERES